MSTGAMPAAALAVTLILALPAADAAAGVPSPLKPQGGQPGQSHADPAAVEAAAATVRADAGAAGHVPRPKLILVASRDPDPPPERIVKPAAKRSGQAARPASRPADTTRAARPHQTGVASYYARHFSGRLMANGQRFDPRSDSIAHRTLPFGTRVRITNMANGRSVVGTVRDRGPYARGRLLDVSPRIAGELGMLHSGVARVAVSHEAPVEIAEAPQ